MKPTIALIALVFTAACGANGEPERPTMNAGVTVSSGGVSPSVSVGTKLGPVRVNVGL